MTAQLVEFSPGQPLRADGQPENSRGTVPTALVCGNFLLRSGLQQILQGTSFVVVGSGSVIGTGLLQDITSEPALFLVDAAQGSGRVLEVARRAKELFLDARIVVLADQFDIEFVRLAHKDGVNGFCSLASGPEVLIKSLELVMLGESVVSLSAIWPALDGIRKPAARTPQKSEREPQMAPGRRMQSLSPREAEILGCLRHGEPNKIIARKLDLTEATIKVHVKAILRKIGVANRTQAAMWAAEHLLAKPEVPAHA